MQTVNSYLKNKKKKEKTNGYKMKTVNEIAKANKIDLSNLEVKQDTSGLFKDSNGGFLKTVGGTLGDLATDIGEGFLRAVEGTTDWAQYRISDYERWLSKQQKKAFDKLGMEKVGNKISGLSKTASEKLINNAKVDSTGALFGKNENQNLFKKGWTNKLEDNSILGDTADTINQGIGQIGAMVGMSYLGGTALGGTNAVSGTATALNRANKMRKATSALTSYSSAYGNARSEAYKNGANDETANKTAMISGFSEAISEQFFDGIPGLKSQGWANNLTGKVAGSLEKSFGTKIGKTFMKVTDALGEGSEEIISNVLQATGNDIAHALDKNYNYGMENQTGNILKDSYNALTSEESLKSFFTAAMTSALVGGADTFLTTTQKNTIIKEYAKENDISFAEAKKQFETTINDETNAIAGNKSFNEKMDIQENIKRQELDNMKKGIFIEKGQRDQAFQYNETENEQVNNMLKSLSEKGNNTSENHATAKMAEKLIKDLGLNIEFTNSEELRAKGLPEADGYKEGNKLVLNLNSNKLTSYVMGHETTHFLENQGELYDAVSKAVFDLATTKGIHDGEVAKIKKLYANIIDNKVNEEMQNKGRALTEQEINKITDDIVRSELTANYVGEFFTDEEFFRTLGKENPSILQKLAEFFDELLSKITGNTERQQIHEAKRKIKKVYAEYMNGSQINLENSQEVQMQNKGITEQKQQDSINIPTKQETTQKQEINKSSEVNLPTAEKIENKNKENAQKNENTVKKTEKTDNETKTTEENIPTKTKIDNEEGIKKIKEKYDTTEKVTGSKKTIVLSNGEKLSGTYKLIEAGNVSASHNAETFEKTEGFPTTENGTTVNDRDYQSDKNAQNLVTQKSDNFDGRAFADNGVIVTKDGIVVSGNDRTMSGDLAAKKGTDTAYIEYLKDNASQFGFTVEQIDNMKHPRVVFELNKKLPYDTKTFAMFNKDAKKSKSVSERAKEIGKTIDKDTINSVSEIIDNFDTIDDLYNNEKATRELISLMQAKNIIDSNDLSDVYNGSKFTGSGKDLVESVILGSVINEDNAKYFSNNNDLKFKVMKAAPALIQNKTLNDYSINELFNNAVEVYKKASSSKMTLDEFTSQSNIFGDNDVDLVTKRIAQLLETKGYKNLRNFIEKYNAMAEFPASGQTDIFSGGQVETKEDILRKALNIDDNTEIQYLISDRQYNINDFARRFAKANNYKNEISMDFISKVANAYAYGEYDPNYNYTNVDDIEDSKFANDLIEKIKFELDKKGYHLNELEDRFVKNDRQYSLSEDSKIRKAVNEGIDDVGENGRFDTDRNTEILYDAIYTNAEKQLGRELTDADYTKIDEILDSYYKDGYYVTDNSFSLEEYADVMLNKMNEVDSKLEDLGFEANESRSTYPGLMASRYYIKDGIQVRVGDHKNSTGYDATFTRKELYNMTSDDIVNYVVEEYNRKSNTKYSLTDNQGRKLTKEQQEYFKNSKVVDDKGNLLTVYRGEPTKGKTEYIAKKGGGNKENNEYGIYFTNSKDFAKDFAFERIQDPNDIFFVKKGKEGELKESYLNITNPLNLGTISREEISNLYDYASDMGKLDGKEAFINNMLNWQRIGNHQLMKMNLDMKKIADNTIYDGLIAKLNVQGDEIEYAVFNSNQIKNVDNTKPTTNADIRYMLSDNGEMVDKESGEKVTFNATPVQSQLPIDSDKSLMVIHNLGEKKMNGILDLGGIPVPSIAVTDPNIVDHNGFGDISLLFDKSTIDPADIRNEIYDRDIWSPTQPQIDYNIDENKLEEVSNKLGIRTYDLEDFAENNSTPEYLADRLSIVEEIVDKYVKDNNIEYEEGYKKPEMRVNFNDNDNIRNFVIDNDFDVNKLVNNENLKQKYFELIKEFYDKSPLQGMAQQAYKDKIEQLNNFIDVQKGAGDGIVRVLKRYQDDFETIKSGENKIIDEWQTNKNKKEAALNNGLKEYLVKEIQPLFTEKGIYNGKDYLTPSGNRRSFWQLHDEYNLENLVNALTKGETTGSEKTLVTGYGQIQAKMSNKFNSIEDIKNAKNQLMPEAEVKKITEEYSNAIAEDIDELSKYMYDSMFSFDNASNLIFDYASEKTHDEKSFMKNAKEYGINRVPTELINKINSDLENLKNIPTDYFEAKPQRAVGLDEIQAAIIPSNTSAELKQRINDAGINYYEYDPTIEGDRNRVINQFNDLKFMLKGDEMSGIYTPKNQFTNRLSDGLIQENLPTEEATNLPTSNTNNEEENIFEKPTRRQVIDRNRQLAREQLGDITKIKDKKKGIMYQINTMKRNLRDIMTPEQAKSMYETYFRPITENNAKMEKDITSYNERIQKYNLNNEESVYTQMLGELRYNPDSELTSKEVNDYYNKNSRKIDAGKVDKAIEEFRSIYDELIGRVNQTLTANGYKEIEYRQGYFPHFIEEKATSPIGKFAEKLGWKVKSGQLPTDIAGITDQFKPGKTWTTFSQHRTGDATDYNALKGLDNYLRGAMDVIHHTNDIQKLRALENEIRYQYSEKGIKEKIDSIYADDTLDMEEKNDAIYTLTNNMRNSGLGNFVTEIRNYTDNLANKKAFGDRSMEQQFGRDTYSIMQNINSRVSANMVGGNISSALTNFIPITQAWSQLSTKNLMKGMYESIKASIKDDGFANNSVYLTNRTKKAERLYKSGLDKINDKLGVPFEAIDSFTSNTIVRAKYHDNIEKGMSEQEAIRNADEFAKDVMAGRSKGDMPTIMNQKNPLMKLMTAFQLEVNNQYGYMFKDIPADLGDEAKRKLVGAFIKMFFGAWLYNQLSEKVTGRKSAFSPIDMAIDDIKTATNENLDLGDKISAIAEDTAQELPFVGGLLGGGRLPIQSAIPYENPLEMVTGTISDVSKTFDEDESKKKNAIKKLMKEWSKPVYYVAMPFGGGQIKKTIEGISMYNENLPVAGSYTDSGKLRFEAPEDTLGKLQAAVFGQYASKNAREYFDNGYQPLTEKQINTALDAGLNINEYREYNSGIKAQENNNDKINYINNLPLENEQKNVLANDVLKRKEKVDISDYGNYGSLEEFDYANKNPGKYNAITQITDYDSYNEYKKKINEIKDQYEDTNERKQAVFSYINSLELNKYQKLMLQKLASGYSIKNYKREMQNYINSLELSAAEKQQIDDALFK